MFHRCTTHRNSGRPAPFRVLGLVNGLHDKVCVTLQVNGAFQRAADALEAGKLHEDLDRVVESLESDPKSALQSLEVTQQVANSATCAKHCLLSMSSQQSRHSHLLACLPNACTASTSNRCFWAICPQVVPCCNCAQLCLQVLGDHMLMLQ